MTIEPKAVLLPILSCVLIAGCAGSGDKYPSLATRDAERIAGEFRPTQPPAPPPQPVASAGEIENLVAAARSAHDRFLSDQRGAEQLVRAASGLGIESDARAQAEVALAGLTTLRSETYRALGDLDRLEVEAATTFAPIDEIEAAQTQVTSLVRIQTEVIGSLQREMAQ